MQCFLVGYQIYFTYETGFVKYFLSCFDLVKIWKKACLTRELNSKSNYMYKASNVLYLYIEIKKKYHEIQKL